MLELWYIEIIMLSNVKDCSVSKNSKDKYSFDLHDSHFEPPIK